jgi:hypothetical protein
MTAEKIDQAMINGGKYTRRPAWAATWRPAKPGMDRLLSATASGAARAFPKGRIEILA